jgi:signal transduction histidine kinase/DNA-binding response OmpR family regulator/HPt (histidine-containing phosphotransfer) domain-containing protein
VALAVFRPGPEEVFLAYWDIIAVPIQLGAVVACLWCARRMRRRSPAQSLGWALIGLAVFVYMLGDLLWMYYEVIQFVEVPAPSWADFFYLAFYLPLVAGVICFLRSLSFAGKMRLLLDSALFAGGAGVLSWYYLVEPLWRQSDVSVLGKSVNTAYCLSDLMVLLCVVALMSRARLAREVRLAMATFAAGILAMSAADVAYWLSVASGRYQSGQWVDLGWNLGCSLIACAPLIAVRAAADSAGAVAVSSAAPARARGGSFLRLVLPYLLTLVTFFFVLHEDVHKRGYVGLGVFLVGLALMILVMVRQVFAYSENLRLYRDLGLLNSRLAQSNAELTEARQHAEEMAERAKAATDAKSRFLANMSHEIRTPLNGVVGMAGLLLKTALDEQQERYARTIAYSADLLLNLINDILDFSKIEAGMMQTERVLFDLRDTLDSVLETFAEQARKKNLDLIPDLPLQLPQSVEGDSHRLRQVLSNLIGNALKFTERGQVVLTCRWWAIDEEKGEARISVQDSGPGIEADRLDRLFRSFSQMDASTTRKYGGTGLGLAISQRLVELMGGTIGVDSILGQGTTFWFTLPLRYQRSAQPSPDISGIPDLPGARVIVVDDNPVNRQVLQAQLEGWGISSESAASGLQTLDRLLEALRQGNPFRIALLDHQMPGMDGLELAQAIRDNPKLSGTALVMLTSLESDLDQQHYQALGISRSLTKPIRQSALFDALMDALHLSREQPGQPSRPPTPPTTSAPSLPHDLRILLAEDNETNQMVVEEILHNEGLQCDIAANGVEAVSLATSRYYDLILMDCQMPEMDGYTATQHIRSHEKGSSAAHVAVIALTASATTTDRDECLAAGMDDYLTKPIVPERLVQMIEKWALPGRQSLEPSTRKSPLQTKETGRSPGFSAAAPFDYGAALARCAGNAVLVRQIVEMFIERTPQELDELEESVARSDAAAVSANAHRLKGGAATLSAEPLSVAAAALEEAGRSGSLAKAPEQFERVRQEFERFLVQAEASLAANKEEPPAAGVQVPVGAIGGKH